MDLVIAYGLQKSCLLPLSKSSDYVIRNAENKKFRNDLRFKGPIQNSATRRFIPLAQKHLDLRGEHFQAALKEFATFLVTKPDGCGLMQGPFALSLNGALRKILNTWGLRLAWTTHHEHSAQIVGGMDAFLYVAPYGLGWKNGSDMGLGHGQGWPV